MQSLLASSRIVLGFLTGRLRGAYRARSNDGGASTLELVILILGLVTVATLFVAALTAAVKSRTDQIL